MCGYPEIKGDQYSIETGSFRPKAWGLPHVYEAWMAALAHEMIRLGVYFRTVALLLQVPGCTQPDDTSSAGREYDEISDLAYYSELDELVAPLAEALKRLHTPRHVIEQILVDYDYDTFKLSAKWRKRLNRWEKCPSNLPLFVCLSVNALRLETEWDEIDETCPGRPWWDRWYFKNRPDPPMPPPFRGPR